MTPDQFVVFDGYVQAGRTVVRFWNEYQQGMCDGSNPIWFYGILTEQRPYHETDGCGGEEGVNDFWGACFAATWFENPDFAEQFECPTIHLSDLEICVDTVWIKISDLVPGLSLEKEVTQ